MLLRHVSGRSWGLHLRHFFGRLVKCLLGPDAVLEMKLEFGNPLVILGICIMLDSEGATFQPTRDKIDKWLAKIVHYLETEKMYSGEASKLSGALQWGSQHIFKKMGRAMLVSIYKRAMLATCCRVVWRQRPCACKADKKVALRCPT